MRYNATLLYNNKILTKDSKNLRVLLERSYRNGLTFDGVNDVVLVTSSASLEITGNDCTISFAIKSNTTAGVQQILSKGSASQRLYSVAIDNNKIGFAYGNGFTLFDFLVYIPFTDTTQINHVVLVKDGNDANNARCYVNGALVAHTVFFNTLTPPLLPNTHNLQIGDHPIGYFTGVAPFNGIIYDLKIFNTALTATEATQLYNTRSEIIPIGVIGNCVLDMRFNEKENFTAYDTSGNVNNGTLTNYTVGDVTLGVTNKWVDEFGNPILI